MEVGVSGFTTIRQHFFVKGPTIILLHNIGLEIDTKKVSVGWVIHTSRYTGF
jgi:hypothetical protein